LALVGALGGVVVAVVSVKLLVSLAPARLPGIGDVRLDWRVIGFTAISAIGAGVLFGSVPAMLLMRRTRNVTVRIGAGPAARGTRAIQHALIATEIALSVILLTGCTLLGRSLLRITATAPGFIADQRYVVELTEGRALWRDDERVQRFAASAVRELAAMP